MVVRFSALAAGNAARVDLVKEVQVVEAELPDFNFTISGASEVQIGVPRTYTLQGTPPHGLGKRHLPMGGDRQRRY